MTRFLIVFSLFLVFLIPAVTRAQHIMYSEPERDDSRRTNFEIIGKVGGNFLVFKSNRADNAISIYDPEMKMKQRVNLDFLPDKYVNSYFIAYPDHFYMIYEYQHKSIVHCSVIKLDASAKRISEPIELDTTQIGFAATNKIYTVIFSEDKQRIMVFKINSKNPKAFLFTTFLYDANMEQVDRHRIYLPMEEKENSFTDFSLGNEGDLVFAKFLKNSGGDFISRVSMVTKAPSADSFSIKDAATADRNLDELKIKIDNSNKRYILTGFYYKQRRGNIDGLYTLLWDKANDTKIKETEAVFTEDLRVLAKSSESSVKMAFNDFFIKQIITKKDGGYLLLCEAEYSTTRGGYFNRWDYMNGGAFMSPGYGYYGPFYSPFNRYNNYNNNAVRYHAENIMVLSFDKEGALEWSNIIPKSQYDDDTENLISYQLINTGGELHFLYNQYEGRNLLLNDQSIGGDGKINRYPTLKNLDKGYEFMPRYGRQISSKQILIPCLYRNYLCFAKVDF